jgi:hypothetical protein
VSSLGRALLAELDREDLLELASLVAPLIVAPSPYPADGWLDTRGAAEYVGMTVPAFQKHANAREMLFEQDCPGGKRWFKREDLDAWRACGRPRGENPPTRRDHRLSAASGKSDMED